MVSFLNLDVIDVLEWSNGAQGRIKFAWSKLNHQRILLMTHRVNYMEVIHNLTGAGSILFRNTHSY